MPSKAVRLPFFSLPSHVSVVCMALPLFCQLSLTTVRGAEGTLTRASDVLALSSEEALSGVPVQVKGIVTVAEKYWDGRFFVQDESGGVFVDNVSTNQPQPGDVIEVRGLSHPGAFAPVISKPEWKKIGTAPLPEPRPVAIDQLMSGVEDSQRVQITGTVRAVRREFGLVVFDLVSGGYRLHVLARVPDTLELQSLVGAHVRVSGTAAASFNATLRQLITVKIFAPLPQDFIIEKSEIGDPMNEPVTPLSGFAQYRKDSAPDKRVHVRGTVVHQRLGEDLFLVEGKRGLHVKSLQTLPLQPGEVVEAVGFRDFEKFLPVLQDAVFRKVAAQTNSVLPRVATMNEVRAGLHHADFITLRGKLLDRSTSSVHRQNSNTQKLVLMLQAETVIFTAEIEKANDRSLSVTAPVGSLLEVSGIALTETDEDGKLKALRLLVPAQSYVQVIKKPSWLTPQRLMVGLAILLFVSVLGLSWTITLSKKNSTLNVLIREKEKAQRELQQAHDLLEERIKERTAQLKFQITARKESEVQSKAVLAERTRLAQELHDTLEQSLTGMALQLDTTSRLFQKNPEGANRHLDLARTLMTQSQVEVRRSIWDLRCRALEQFDLAGALRNSARLLTEGSNIRVEVKASGRVRPLPERIEDNLLRMAQEALTNVIKHSAATTANIELNFGPKNIVLVIQDNGAGFNPNDCSGPRDGHFGLLGIAERAKRLAGLFSLTSAPAAGTSIRISIPLDSDDSKPAELNGIEAVAGAAEVDFDEDKVQDSTPMGSAYR